MKKIKVQLDFNITKKTHSLYHSFLNNPPEGVEYVKSEFVGINDRSYSTLGKIYKNVVKIFPFVSRFHQKFNDILRKDSGSDLIHFTFHFGKTKKRCVVDYETGYSFININDKENKLVKNRMIIVGADYKKIKDFIKKDFIIYLEKVDREEIKYYYNVSDFLFYLSRYDGGAPTLVVSEAMASGCPIIFSKDSQQEIIKDKENGIIIDKFNIESSEIIMEILKKHL